MTWLNPWIVRQGTVTSIERSPPWHALTDVHTTTFQIGRAWFRYRGSTLPIAPGKQAIVVGWKVAKGVEANFVVLPDDNKLFRPYRGWSGFVFGLAAIIIAGWLLTIGLLVAGIVVFGFAVASIFYGVAWREGYRLAQSHLQRQRKDGTNTI